MQSIRELLAAKGLSRIADAVEASVRPTVYLASGEQSEDPCCRLGGRPNLPLDIGWPTWRGRSLPFVAQLDLAALPRINGLDLPAHGSLYFFYEGGEKAWGFKPEDRGSAQVIYAPSSLEHARRTLPDDIPADLRFSGVRLEVGSSDISLPDGQDELMDLLNLNADQRDEYWEFLEAWREQMPPTFHRVGGYPEPIQGDPKLEAHLASHGLYCGSAEGYQRGKELGLLPGAADWELMLQVDSDDRAGMMWGDLGRLYFLIHKEALQQRTFQDAWLVFQCS